MTQETFKSALVSALRLPAGAGWLQIILAIMKFAPQLIEIIRSIVDAFSASEKDREVMRRQCALALQIEPAASWAEIFEAIKQLITLLIQIFGKTSNGDGDVPTPPTPPGPVSP